jgi:hypothetical protein
VVDSDGVFGLGRRGLWEEWERVEDGAWGESAACSMLYLVVICVWRG